MKQIFSYLERILTRPIKIYQFNVFPIFNLFWLLKQTIFICSLNKFSTFKSTLKKAAYADSYWFLYSSKVVYYTKRHI